MATTALPAAAGDLLDKATDALGGLGGLLGGKD